MSYKDPSHEDIACLRALQMRVLLFSNTKGSTWGPTAEEMVLQSRQRNLEFEQEQERLRKEAEEARKKSHPMSREAKPYKKKHLYDPRLLMSHMFQKCVDKMVQHEAAEWFEEPVDVETFYDYFLHVSEPMDIETVRNNVQVLGYGSFEEFTQDCDKIYHNSIAYNGLENDVTELALQMIESG